MPVFFLLVILGAIALWFLACTVYKPIGKLIHKIIANTTKELNYTEPKSETENKKENC